MNRSKRALQIVLFCLVSLAIPRRATFALDRNAEAARLGLVEIGRSLQAVGVEGALSQAIPVMDKALSDDAVLCLGRVFAETVADLAATPSPSLGDFNDLQAFVDSNAPSVSPACAGVNVALALAHSSTGGTLPDPGRGQIALRFTVTLHRAATTYDVHIAGHGGVDLRGGATGKVAVPGLTFRAVLELRVDPAVLGNADPHDDDQAVSIVGAPTMTAAFDAPATVGGTFGGRVGFTDVTATGSGTVTAAVHVRFRDLDADGRIPTGELASTSVADLFDIGFDTGAGVDAHLAVSAVVGNTTLTGAVDWTDANLADGLAAPTFDFGGLDPFTTVKPREVLAGLGFLASSIAAAQRSNRFSLPFLDDDLTAKFDAAAAILKFVDDESKKLPDGTFQDPSFATAQELCARLLTLAGVNAGKTCAQLLAFDPSSRALTFDLDIASNPDPIDGKLSFGDRLAERTNIVGLAAGSGASASIDPRDVNVQLTFGALLVDDVTQITPDADHDKTFKPDLIDRFFIKVGSGPEIRASADVKADVELKGQIGFVDVTAHKADSNLSLLPADPAAPMLSIDIAAPGIDVKGLDPAAPDDIRHLDDATGFRELVTDLGARVSATCNLAAQASLEVNATVGGHDLLAAPLAVAVHWPKVFAPASCRPDTAGLTVDAPNFEPLRNLDPDPRRFGTHTGPASATVLKDPRASFDASLEGRVARNVTDGSSCTIAHVVDANTLACAANLKDGIGHGAARSDANTWQSGDRYDIDGDPLALMAVLLDNLDKVIGMLDKTAAGPSLDVKLPLISKSPRDLIGALKDVHATLDDIRAGQPDVAVTCYRFVNGVLETELNGVAAGEAIYCRARTKDGVALKSGSVAWSFGPTGAPGSAPLSLQERTSGAAADITVSHDPLCADSDPRNCMAVVKVIDTAVLTAPDFSIGVSFSDPIPTNQVGGGDRTRTGKYPSPPLPSSLTALEAMIERGLGLQDHPDALTFALGDVPRPAGDTLPDVRDLLVKLHYGLCTRDPAKVNGNPVVVCDARDRTVDKLATRFNVELPPDVAASGLVGFDTAGAVQLDYAVQADLDLAIPLRPRLDAASVAVIDTTGIKIQAAGFADDLKLDANLGPLVVHVGNGVTLVEGRKATGGDGSTLIDSGFDFAKAALHVTEGSVVENKAQGWRCIVTAVAPSGDKTKLTCDPDGDGAWHDGDAYSVLGAGLARVGAGFSLQKAGIDAIEANQTFTADTFLGGLDVRFAPLPGLLSVGCFSAGAAPLNGHACANIALEVENVPNGKIGNIGFAAPNLMVPSGWHVDPLPGLADLVKSNPLNWDLLLRSLPELLATVKTQLEKGSKIPILGGALDAGAKIVDKLETEVVGPIYNSDLVKALKALPSPVTASDVTGKIKEMLDGELSASGLLLPPASTAGVKVIARCGSAECAADVDASGIDEIEVIFDVGKQFGGLDSDQSPPPFDIGVPGLPLRLQGALDAQVGWKLHVDFGLSRADGPFLVVGKPADAGNVKELTIDATAALGEGADDDGDGVVDACADDLDAGEPDAAVMDGTAKALKGEHWSPKRCLAGTLGFLKVTMRDGATNDWVTAGNMLPAGDPGVGHDRSAVRAQTSLDLTESGDGRLSYLDLAGTSSSTAGSGAVGLAFAVGFSAHIDVRFRTSLGSSTGGLPSMLGTFHLDFAKGFDSSAAHDGTGVIDVGPSLRFADLHLDAGTFIGQFLGNALREVQKITKPLMPVIDTVMAPIPGISDLSEMTGNGKITFLDALSVALADDPDALQLIKRIIGLIRFINALPSGDKVIWLPLGGDDIGGAFSLLPNAITESPPSPGSGGSAIDTAPKPDTDPNRLILADRDDLQSGLVDETREPNGGSLDYAFESGSGLTFPFLEQPLQLFKMLLGEDVTLIRYDAGTLNASAGISYTFGPFWIGPVPVSVTIGGSISLRGRFAMGYDTRGLRLATARGGNAVKLLDGIFIDDLDANGVDVPEITLVGTVSVSAQLDLLIFQAGVRAGIELRVDFNLDDKPVADGKLYIDEIAHRLSNPFCLFVIDGRLKFFIELFVKIDILIWKHEWNWRIVEATLLDFHAACTDPGPPVLAFRSGADLVLKVGPYAKDRHIEDDNRDEKVIVRQTSPIGADRDPGTDKPATRVSVTLFDAQQTWQVGAGGRVLADGGNGADIISYEAGNDELADGKANTASLVPFTLETVTCGGNGADEIRTGDAHDEVWGDDAAACGGFAPGVDRDAGAADGDPGDDRIVTRGDPDTAHGQAGNDHIDGLLGADDLFGDAGDDVLSGGPGNDHLHGDDGADELLGADGDDTAWGGVGDDNLVGSLGNDTLLGEGGDDTAEGDQGDDLLFGGTGHDRLAGDNAALGAAESGRDKLIGDDGNDDVLGGLGADVLDGGAGDDLVLGDSSTLGGDRADHVSDAFHGSPADPARLARVKGIVTVLADAAGGTTPPARCVDARAFDVGAPGVAAEGTGNADCLFGGAGSDFVFGEGDADRIDGGDGPDYAQGDDGDDEVGGGPGEDILHGNAGQDHLTGQADSDAMFGDDGADDLQGNTGDDTMHGGDGDDALQGNDDADTLFGDRGADRMQGDDHGSATVAGNDRLWGGLDDDRIEGNGGDDALHGDPGQDILFGDSTDDHRSLGSDVMDGDAGHDVLLGDNGIVTDAVDGPALWPGGAPNRAARLAVPQLGGADRLDGGTGNDALYAGAGDDIASGGVGDDHVEGNGGSDRVYGLSASFETGPSAAELDGLALEGDQDDLIGGSSTVHPDAGSGPPDGGEIEMAGGDGADVMIGDNGEITRTIAGAQWATDSATGDVRRAVTLFDVNRREPVPAGGDRMSGGAGIDWLWGQAGNDDMAGGGAVDHVEGDTGDDTVHGNAGDDLLVGGTTDNAILLTDGRIGDPPPWASPAFLAPAPATSSADGLPAPKSVQRTTVNQTIYLPVVANGNIRQATPLDYSDAFDGDDVLYGDDGADVILGDNGHLETGGRTAMKVTAPGTYGDDRIFGGDGDDQAYGQLGDDTIAGEGQADYALGDLGAILSAASAPAVWPGGAPNRTVALIAPDTGGADTIDGGPNDDHLYGGAANDDVAGGTADDHVEGNGGADRLFGLSATYETAPDAAETAALAIEGDQDDLWGGSSSVHPAYATGAADGGEQTMQGNAGADVLIGDNGAIVRTVDGDRWRVDAVGDVFRDVTLADVQRGADTVPPLSAVSGGDRMEGNGGRDHLWGQGGNDCMKGDDDEADADNTHDDDYLEGNQGTDWMEGNARADDVIGGSRLAGAAGDKGIADAGDFMFGGAGADVLTGDNAVIDRGAVNAGQVTVDTASLGLVGMTTRRGIVLRDLKNPPATANFGNDQLSGGPGEDVLLGQDGDDVLSGGADNDHGEGNGGRDALFGDRALSSVAPAQPRQLPAGIPAPPPELAACGSDAPTGGPAGQDNLIGGSSLKQHRDAGDWLYGDDGADFMLGDNGRLLFTATAGAYAIDVERYTIGAPPAGARILRTVDHRFDTVGEPTGVPIDYLEGDGGDDAIWGQNGDDLIYGNEDNDELYGDLGDDALNGGPGMDALLGDLGSITTRLIDGSPGDEETVVTTAQVPNIVPGLRYEGFVDGTLDRRVDLRHDLDGTVLQLPHRQDGDDVLRGGSGRDHLHGGGGDDLMNGDSGGDVLFGDDGADVMWGGLGNPDTNVINDPGAHDQYVDALFGGSPGVERGTTGRRPDGADLLDYLPRPNDPQSWRDAVAAYNDGQGKVEEPLRQHHQGPDLLYGGAGRDVLQADYEGTNTVAGDRLIDWLGEFNLYTHCDGGISRPNQNVRTDIRQSSPSLLLFVRAWAYGSGVGASLSEVAQTNSSAFHELGLVNPLEPAEANANRGPAFPSNPSNFRNAACD